MTRDERLGVARELTRRLLARHGDAAIVAVAVHGPLARDGDQVDEVDEVVEEAGATLDLAVVTADPGVDVPERALRYGDTVIDLGVISAAAYLDEAGHVGPLWPLAAEQYRTQLALHDPGGFFHRLRHVHEAAVAEAGAERFAAAAGYDLVQLIAWEGRARAAELAGDLPGALLATREGALLTALVVGLLTRTAYRDEAHALRATATIAGVPTGVAEPYRRLLSPTTDPTAAVLALGRVVAALTDLARQRGVPFETDDLGAFVDPR